EEENETCQYQDGGQQGGAGDDARGFRLSHIRSPMLRLGHIDYSNCVPVHADLLRGSRPDVQIVHGTPAVLNRALAAGEIDVAPCSSIEYARHADRYRILPDLAIGSFGPVQSIRLESTQPLDRLEAATVAIPTASATSVVLLRVLLELRFGVRAELRWFDQESGDDPIAAGADAVLWIGDLALRRAQQQDRTAHDLGALWTEWTGLPFAFALWQTGLGAQRDPELQRLHRLLLESRSAALSDPDRVAREHAHRLQLAAARLADYWRGLHYVLDPAMLRGLLRFYEHAATLGEIDQVPALRFVPAVI
ncbi:MAG TPA: menaquinone biosynthesis protein, partial [Longimicrobiales bacterium]|nr:menaquinone biosynthesis protein [Longimicrobiales bacterium]